MAKLKFEGMDNWLQELEALESNTAPDIGKAVYEGAKVVADAVRASIQALPVEKSRHGSPEHPLRGVTKQQKQALLDGFGVSRIKLDGDFYNVKLGFDGYYYLESSSGLNANYGHGAIPIVIIARSVNNGTYFRKRTGFIDKAVNRSKAQAERAMVDAFNKAIQERTR